MFSMGKCPLQTIIVTTFVVFFFTSVTADYLAGCKSLLQSQAYVQFLVEPFLLTFICVCFVRSSHVICIVNSTSLLDKLFLLWEQMLLHTVKTKKMRKSCQRHGTVKFYFQGSRKDFPSDQTTALGGQRLQKIIARYIWHRSKRQLVLLPTTAARRFGIVFNEAILHYVHV